MKKNTIKLFSAAAAVIMAVSSCGSEAAVTTVVSESAQNDVPEVKAPLSNPVAVDENGDVDMKVALAYETDFDALKAQLEAKKTDPDHPVSENSNEETVALYKWLRENYGKNVISGQQQSGSSWTEAALYYYQTGDLPALMGFDFIFVTTPSGDGADWTQMAIDWHNECGGIVSFCWHWNVPTDVDNEDLDNCAHAFYSKNITNFSLANAVTPGTKEYEVAVHDIDRIAIELQRLEAAGVPVIWRPLHEASGAWFWWGAANKEIVENEYYQKLWYMIFDRLENYHKLTNLIWLWNGQSKHTMVNENTYDIAGIDVYPPEDSKDHSVQQKSYEGLQKISADGKMLTLSEVGFIPDSDELAAKKDDVKWLFFMPWNNEFIYKGTTVMGIPKINESKMDNEFLKKVYSADNIITWSELPAFDGTKKELPAKIQMMLHDMEVQREKDGK